ncbi:hypothetical protein HDU91_003409, partial [Kappamyces sp. JEL0680]
HVVIHEAGYIDDRYTVNWKKEKIEGPLMGDHSPFVEIRHYGEGDLKFSIVDKVCGKGSQRRFRSAVRQDILIDFLTAPLQKVEEPDIVVGADMLHQFLYRTTRKHVQPTATTTVTLPQPTRPAPM